MYHLTTNESTITPYRNRENTKKAIVNLLYSNQTISKDASKITRIKLIHNESKEKQRRSSFRGLLNAGKINLFTLKINFLMR